VSSPEAISPRTIVPVFPLPNVVFFPETVLPLYVFEERYREMVQDCASGEGLIAMALLRPDWEEDYLGSPAIHRVGTVGRIRNLNPLADERFSLELVGLARAQYQEIPSPGPYRLVHVDPRPEPAVDDDSDAIREAKLELLTLYGNLLAQVRDEGAILPDERLSFEAAVNRACASLPVEPALRQLLLEEDDLLQRHSRATALLESILTELIQTPAAPN
jgi:Lon protease-like protein